MHALFDHIPLIAIVQLVALCVCQAWATSAERQPHRLQTPLLPQSFPSALPLHIELAKVTLSSTKRHAAAGWRRPKRCCALRTSPTTLSRSCCSRTSLIASRCSGRCARRAVGAAAAAAAATGRMLTRLSSSQLAHPHNAETCGMRCRRALSHQSVRWPTPPWCQTC